MQRLQERDFRLLLEFLRGLYAPRDLDAFVKHVLSALPGVIPSELTSYNEMIPEKRASANWTNPELRSSELGFIEAARSSLSASGSSWTCFART